MLEPRENPAVFTANNQLDVPLAGKMNLREAIIAANLAPNPVGGVDTITFSIPLQELNRDWLTDLNSALPPITDGVEINGFVLGVGQVYIQGFGIQDRVFNVFLAGPKVNDPVTFKSLIIRGGNPTGINDAGGVVRSVGANLTMSDCTISGGYTSSHGGGIFASGPATGKVVIDEGTKIENNTTFSGNGGGIAVFGPDLTLGENVKILNNTAGKGGGGVYLHQSNNLSVLGAAELVSISGNTALDGDGGGILVMGQPPGGFPGIPTVNLQKVLISDNKAYEGSSGQGRGGGIAVFGFYQVDADRDTVVSNNGQSAPPPVGALCGVLLDAPLPLSTFWTKAKVTDNYQMTTVQIP